MFTGLEGYKTNNEKKYPPKKKKKALVRKVAEPVTLMIVVCVCVSLHQLCPSHKHKHRLLFTLSSFFALNYLKLTFLYDSFFTTSAHPSACQGQSHKVLLLLLMLLLGLTRMCYEILPPRGRSVYYSHGAATQVFSLHVMSSD